MNVAIDPATLVPSSSVWLDEKVWRSDAGLYYQKVGDQFELLIRRRGHIPGPLIPIFVCLGAVMGFAFTMLIVDSAKPAPYKIEYSEAQLAQPYFIDKTFPGQMLIHIVPETEITARSKIAYAVSYSTLRPCEIYIPAGQEIWVRPQKKQAGWANSYQGDVLAHEILHCLRGVWHPQ